MSTSHQSGCTCGCCAGTSVETPLISFNRPGQSSLTYRAGAWNSFKESMLARLSSSEYPALKPLATRNDDDFTIAFLDATATVLDILTFYQERIANESYLRTATELRSLTELSRLIGYTPAPGVSASVYVAFTLKEATGEPPDPTRAPITIPKGTHVQSVPAQNQTPQTFETFADIQAKPDWNALPVQTGVSWAPQSGDTSVYATGTSTQLQPGDLILVVGDERVASTGSRRWDLRVVTSVAVDSTNAVTLVTWSQGLGWKKTLPAQTNPKLYAFRQRASLFGYNAVSPFLLKDITFPTGSVVGDEWVFTEPVNLASRSIIDLDVVYSKIVPDSWIALLLPPRRKSESPLGFVSLYRADSVTTISRTAFALSGKTSRIATDTDDSLSTYYEETRDTSAVAQSEELAVSEQPLPYPLYGTAISLGVLRTDMAGVQAVAIYGRRQKVVLSEDSSTPLLFVPDSGVSRDLEVGDVLTLIDPSPLPTHSDGTIAAAGWADSTTNLTLYVEDAFGRTGTVEAPLGLFAMVASSSDDPIVSEFALVSQADTTDAEHTVLQLSSVLTNCYNRAATTVNANVGLATHGTGVSEILGSGSASTPNQSFQLKQSPLTFIQSPTPTGRATTLEVLANEVVWSEATSLYSQGPTRKVFTTVNKSDGTTAVIFGDGVEGALLPSGQNNIRANYRIGSGAAGNVGARTLTTLMDRPLGVSGVTNPAAASGGQDAQSTDDIRSNAPQTVLTLGRAVSITDYQNYAKTFAGISKASAIWIPSGSHRGVFLTVAGVAGAALPSGNPTLTNLITSLQSYGNPLIPITAESYVETLFTFSATLRYRDGADTAVVDAAVLEQLAETFSFENRSFGQGVSLDEIVATIHLISEVEAVNVTGLTRGASSTGGDLANLNGYSVATAKSEWMAQSVTLNRPFADSATTLYAYLPAAEPDAAPQPAEILVLDPTPGAIVLGVMA